jgi:hypothetical protein
MEKSHFHEVSTDDLNIIVLIAQNSEGKSKYGDSFPSLPKCLRKRKLPPESGHTSSVISGYTKRVHNFLSDRKKEISSLKTSN